MYKFDEDFTEVCFQGPSENIPALVHIMAWRQPGDAYQTKSPLFVYYQLKAISTYQNM